MDPYGAGVIGARSRSGSAQSLLRIQPGWPSTSKGGLLEQAVQDLAVSDELLGQDQASQKLRSEIGTIRPGDGAKLGIDVGLFELFGIAKLLEDRACQLGGQIDFSMGSIVKMKEQRMLCGDLDRGDVKHDCDQRRHYRAVQSTVGYTLFWVVPIEFCSRADRREPAIDSWRGR
jgi:hypothetical protein